MIRINRCFLWPLRFRSISLTVFGFTLNFVDIFLDIHLKCLYSNRLMTQAIHRRLELIQLMITWLSRNRPRINSWLKCIPQVLIQMDSWLKCFPIFRFKSTRLKRKAFHFECTHDSTQSHTHVWCLHTKVFAQGCINRSQSAYIS